MARSDGLKRRHSGCASEQAAGVAIQRLAKADGVSGSKDPRQKHSCNELHFQAVDRQKGKFRSWLLASMGHFLSNEWARRKTEKRGGKVAFLSLDTADGETRYHREPAHGLTPERIYERRWALTLLEKVLADLQAESAADGKTALFDALQVHRSGHRAPNAYAQSAANLDMTEGAVRIAVFRLRRRLAEMLREEIVKTVASPAEIDEEIRHLFAALSS